MNTFNDIHYEWEEEKGIAICALTYKNNYFIGMAQCHEDDQDMKSEKTGYKIAEIRAMLKYYTHLRDNEIKPVIQGYNHLVSTMINSKQFNIKSYEAKRIFKELKLQEEELTAINYEIKNLKKYLLDMLKDKENFYQHVRKNRQKGKNI